MKAISDLLLNITGWKIDNEIAEDVKKAVIIVAPHLSYWDFIIGKFSFWHLEIDSKLLIKKEAFFWPLGKLLRSLGGIPVNRTKASRLTSVVAKMFDEHNSLFNTITTEGTRSLVKNWKLGFYYIACAANVPIILGLFDYKNKTGGMKELFYLTGNLEKDLVEIQSFYKGIDGKNPEKSKIFDN
jgi:1-acyl-sn-glycerol-3-phosphate acyltransferase